MSAFFRPGPDGADTSGAVALIFAFAVIPLIALVGAAIDYQRSATTRSKMQTALDAAALAGARETSPADRIKVANAIFASNMATLGVNDYAAAFTQNADNTFSGKAQGSVPTTFMRIVKFETMTIGAKTRVGVGSTPLSTPTSATFTATSAKGWFWKGVTLWVHHPGDATDTALATYSYQADTLLNGGTGTLSGPFGTAISLGSNYDKLYLTMAVYDDGCGPGEAPLHPEAILDNNTAYWDVYSCVPESPQAIKTSTPYVLSTADPQTANHLFVDGVQAPLGSAVNILSLLKCNATVRHEWEDTKIYDPGADAWKTQDFNFKVQSGPCAANSAMVTPTVRLME